MEKEDFYNGGGGEEGDFFTRDFGGVSVFNRLICRCSEVRAKKEEEEEEEENEVLETEEGLSGVSRLAN